MEELDLDSFLRRHNAGSGDDSDDDNHAGTLNLADQHRTIDDILNDSDSSSSSSPPSSRVSLSLSSFKHNRSNSQPKTLNSVEKPSNPTLLKYNLIQRLKSDGFSSRKSPSKPPSLFSGGVLSPAKPGAALAAAAAASRSIPTRHAAAIMSRRALSVSTEGKVSDSDENLGFARDDLSDRVDSRSENGDRDGGDGNEHVEERIQESDSSFVESTEKIDGEEPSNDNENEQEEKEKSMVDLSIEMNEVDMNGHDKSTISESNGVGLIGSEYSDDKEVGSHLEFENEGNTDVSSAGLIMKSESDVGNDDLSSIADDVAVLVEDRIVELASERASNVVEEKVISVKKRLELAEEMEKKQASTGLDLEEGAAAQPMRLEGVRRGSTVLGYFDTDADNMITRTIKSQAFRRDYGMPQVLAVHLNYIALGMSKGVVVVVPSKYSAHHPDNMDPKMLMLGTQGERSQVPVMSICFNQQGDLLLAGYGDGHITVWNIPRGTVAKVITGEHTAPVVHSLFLGQDSQVTRQFKAVTGDCKGLVLLHELSVMPLLGFTVKSQCLLDGQRTGTVLCASPLLPDEITGGASVTSHANTTGSTSSIGGVMGGVVGGAAGWKLFSEGSSLPEEGVVIFVTHQTALVV